MNKPIDWRGSSLDDLREFPEVARRVAGYELKFEEAIYVLHSFQKKTRKTSQNDVEVAKARYRAVVAERKASK